MSKFILSVFSVLFLMLVSSLAYAESFGAIAWSFEDGIWGSYTDAHNRATAEKQAVKQCKSGGGIRCEPMVWFTECGAFAMGEDDAYGVGFESTAKKAEKEALAACKEQGKKCKVIGAVCNEE